ncbi:helix-turn-helix domain-containing protein [Paraburkholderia terricola]|uniref:Transcriptional regulator with XRE-family HTH domain n=1 Tax=Paraburkholderia terricola TaxID=169427 RepID=A0ABU1LXV9_9BURK|nr:helix-turn-helix domain-containing protein [Paraburkholderia terricola]MDR6411365.1 transcriptional regulator with XRE-family HTH domain [Paraburkholderia terricola]MDR6483395.1 transcriptional regulator with XRE-family HTH domain [Paraburkholderia terricola]
MTKQTLKKLRVEAGMTQIQVATAMGVSQPNYQRWESGSAPVPKTKLKKLARTLKTSVDELLGKPADFDLFGVERNIPEHRTYFGELAIHFEKGLPILLPVSEEMRSSLHRQLSARSTFIVAESLDNRMVFIRRNAVTDIYISSEAYDTFGPEEYVDHLGVAPDDDFWKIVESLEYLEDVRDEFEESRIAEVLGQVRMTEAALDELIKTGNVSPEDREKVWAESMGLTEKFLERAQTVSWQLSSGQLRHEYVQESRLLYEVFSFLEFDNDDMDGMICMPLEGYHRTIAIRKSALDYISIPKHKFHEGSIECAEEELDAPRF